MKVDAATSMVPVAVLLAVGVNVAVYPVPDPANAERDHPATVTSPEVKLTEGSERVNVIAEVAPELTLVGVAPIVIVGARVSSVNDVTGRRLLVLLAASVTTIVQLL